MKKTLLTILSMVLCLSMQAATLVDELTSTLTGITTTTYTSFTIDGSKTTSGTAYAGLCAGTTTYIQLRSATDKNYSGIYNTTSCGKVTKISVTWDASSYNRTINFYGSQTPFSSTEELYGDNLTMIGSVTGPATQQSTATTVEIDITGDYPYIGMRSNDGALYIDMIAITWEGEAIDNPDSGDGGGTTGGTGHGYEPDDPFTASEAFALAQTLSSSETLSGVYVKGIVSQINEISTSYGNATYFISDDGSATDQLEIFRGYYLGGDKFTNEDQIQDGDEVVVTGDLINYYGNTPEITTGNHIYSLNGKTSDDGDGGGTTGGTGHGYEADDPFTPSEAVALAETLSSSDTVTGVYVKGIISRIDELSTSYGNATYFISDDGSTSNQLEIYRGYYLDGEKFTSEDQIKVSDTVLVTGDLVNFYGNTPELTTGSKIVSIEEGDGSTSGNEPDPSLIRTLENSSVTAGSETATIDFTSQGLENSTNVDEVVFTLSDGSTVVFEKADGNNPPTYYTSGTAVRVYALNTITFACSQEIAKIEMICSESQYLGNDTYTIEWSDTGAVYCNYQEENGEPKNSGGTQLRIQQIIVTYAGETGDEDGISSVRSDVDGDGVMYNIGGQRVSDSYRGIVIVNGRKILKK